MKSEGSASAGMQAPSIVHDVINSAGQPLDTGTRNYFEPRFGHDFSNVKIHTGSKASESSKAINAHAYTLGNNVVFNNGKYAPHTDEGKRLLAHELTHVIQQKGITQSKPFPGHTALQSDHTIQRWSLFDDEEEDKEKSKEDESGGGIIDWVADKGGAALDAVSQTGGGAVDWTMQKGDAAVDTVTQAGSDVVDWAKEKANDAVDSATQIGGDAVDWAKDTAIGIGNSAVNAGEDAYDWAKQKSDDATDALKKGGEALYDAGADAVDWITTEAGQLALDAANRLAGRFGGSITISGTNITVTIPNVSLFDSFQKELGDELPAIPIFHYPFGGGAIGPFIIEAGLEINIKASMLAAVGPGELRNISVSFDPFAGTFAGHAQLYVAGAIGSRIPIFEGIVGRALGVIPTEPPIPILGSVEGGVRGTITGWGIGAFMTDTDVTYSSGSWNFAADNSLMIGVLMTGDVDIYAAVKLYEKIVCDFAHPLGHWESGEAVKVNLPISLGEGKPPSIGPITSDPFPISDIETAIEPLKSGLNCKGIEEIIEELCEEEKIPKEICDELLPKESRDIEPPSKKPRDTDQPGIAGTTYACAICKCSGDPECGGGRIHTIWMGKTECNRENKKKAQKKCNHDNSFLRICDLNQNRPDKKKCSVHHHDFACSEKETKEKCDDRRQ